MKILALDSSGLVASVAIVEDENLIAEYTVNYKKTHSQTLIPMLNEIVQMTELDLETIDAIACAGGPGSFTGLRIGAATAKGLGQALEKPLIHIPTVDGLAYNMFGTKQFICPLMDARREQVYTGIYFFEKEFEVIEQQMAVAIEVIIKKINEYKRPVVFLGDGVPVFKERLLKEVSVPISFAPCHMNRQRAGAIGALAQKYLKEGNVLNAAEFQPNYLRLSQAERERMEKEKVLKEKMRQE